MPPPVIPHNTAFTISGTVMPLNGTVTVSIYNMATGAFIQNVTTSTNPTSGTWTGQGPALPAGTYWIKAVYINGTDAATQTIAVAAQ